LKPGRFIPGTEPEEQGLYLKKPGSEKDSEAATGEATGKATAEKGKKKVSRGSGTGPASKSRQENEKEKAPIDKAAPSTSRKPKGRINPCLTMRQIESKYFYPSIAFDVVLSCGLVFAGSAKRAGAKKQVQAPPNDQQYPTRSTRSSAVLDSNESRYPNAKRKLKPSNPSPQGKRTKRAVIESKRILAEKNKQKKPLPELPPRRSSRNRGTNLINAIHCVILSCLLVYCLIWIYVL
jgi:hypothetical protein